MLVLRLQLKKQLFHGDRGKDLKLFPVGLSRVLCPKTQGLFDPQRTPGSQLSHLCLTSAGSENGGLKVKFRLCHFSAVQETTQTFTAPEGPADPPDTHREDRAGAGLLPTNPTQHNKPKLALLKGSGQTHTWRATQLLDGASQKKICFSKRKSSSRSQQTHKPHNSASLMLH